MIDVAMSDVWSDWTTLGSICTLRHIWDCQEILLFCRTANLPVVEPHRSPNTLPCREPCSLDQPNHSLQAYAVSIEEMNVVDNSACKIRTVATVAANADQYSGRCRSILELRSP